MSLFLHSVGVPKGRKTDTEFLVPDWIFDGDKEYKRNYLRGLYACEGCIYSTKQKNEKLRWRICLEMYKLRDLEQNGREFFQQLREMLQEFNINTSPVRNGSRILRKNGTFSIGVKFEIESKDLMMFDKQIEFDEDTKARTLQNALDYLNAKDI